MSKVCVSLFICPEAWVPPAERHICVLCRERPGLVGQSSVKVAKKQHGNRLHNDRKGRKVQEVAFSGVKRKGGGGYVLS